jgi:hypothetical protein
MCASYPELLDAEDPHRQRGWCRPVITGLGSASPGLADGVTASASGDLGYFE